MEELTMIINALSKMGDGATTLFIWWCVKEIIINSFCLIAIAFVGVTAFKLIRHWQKHEFRKRGG